MSRQGGDMRVFFCLLMLMLLGPANRNNANDNTSGVAAVMEIMARLPEEERSKAAFILFDNEEKGLLGSAGYAAQHKGVKEKGLIINLDCVGDGENILFFANKKTRALPQYALLQEALFSLQQAKQLHDRLEALYHPYVDFQKGAAMAQDLICQLHLDKKRDLK